MTAALVLGAGLVVLGAVFVARVLDARAWRRSLLALEIRLPLGLATEDVERWLNTVAAATYVPHGSLLVHPPLVLEVVADVGGVRHVLLVPRSLRATVLAGLRAALPGVRIQDDSSYLAGRRSWAVGVETVAQSRRRQMAVDRAEGTATAVLATLQPLGPGERVVVQWIMTGAGTPDPVPSMGAGQRDGLPDWLAGEELTDGEAIRSARVKQSQAMLHGVLRIAATANTPSQARVIVGRVVGQYRGLNAPGVELTRRWWVEARHAAGRVAELSLPVIGWPALLSTRELSGLLPFPVGDVALPGVTVGLARQLPPPTGLPSRGGVQIGVSNYPDIRTPLRLTDADRLQHLHVLGPTGVGKSTLLANLILQDIAAGHGVIVIDPKSDLVSAILERVPEHRVADVIVLDPAATDLPVGFNILQSAHDEQSRELVVDHVIHIWHELYEDFWGPRSEDVLRGALLTLINAKAGNGEAFTLIETPTLLTDAPLRKFVTAQAGVPSGLETFWAWYRGTRPDERLRIIGPILNKLRAATLRTPIRLMLGQSAGLDLDTVLAERKVLLVPLSAGTLGSETAGLLGTILLAGIWFAIMRRVEQPASQRHPVFIYVDEAQSVLKLPVDLADMLAQARGLGAGFTLAHQHLGQIEDKQVKSAILGTIRSQIVFQCLREDAATLAPSYEPRLTANDLMGLDRWEIAARACVAGQTLAPFTGTTLPLPGLARNGQALALSSRERLGRPTAGVEASLKARGSAPDAPVDDKQPRTRAKSGSPTFGRRRASDDSTGGTA